MKKFAYSLVTYWVMCAALPAYANPLQIITITVNEEGAATAEPQTLEHWSDDPSPQPRPIVLFKLDNASDYAAEIHFVGCESDSDSPIEEGCVLPLNDNVTVTHVRGRGNLRNTCEAIDPVAQSDFGYPAYRDEVREQCRYDYLIVVNKVAFHPGMIIDPK